MNTEPFTFRDLVQPMTAEDFFARCYAKSAVRIPGPDDKFADVFSWDACNRLLNMSALWSEKTLKMALHERNLEAEEYCGPGINRDGQRVLRPDIGRVHEHLRQGATLVLDLIETLSPEIAAVGAMLEVVTGAPLSCNAYCSWNQQQGFGSHFDTMDVFVLHIAGTKTWHVYDGRFEHPMEVPGYNHPSFPREHHEKAKGNLLQEMTLTPGDMLYLPKGQYHDALASSEVCLHLSFGITEATGHDLIGILARDLPTDPLFRRSLPDHGDGDAHAAHVKQLADRLRDIVASRETSETMRDYQRQRAQRCLPGFALPGRDDAVRYRVRFLGASVTAHLGIWKLKTDAGEESLGPEEAEVAEWVLARDWFDRDALRGAFTGMEGADMDAVLDKLGGAGLIEGL
jgi:hypothetical protein